MGSTEPLYRECHSRVCGHRGSLIHMPITHVYMYADLLLCTSPLSSGEELSDIRYIHSTNSPDENAKLLLEEPDYYHALDFFFFCESIKTL